jgi:hypothetical protein
MNALYKPAPRVGERWTHVHDIAPRDPATIASDFDVFETIAAREELSLATHQTNLLGQFIMNTPSPTALAAAMTKAHIIAPGTIESGHTYFDPVDMLEDKLGHYPVMLSRVLDSTTWMLDSSCITQARMILFTRWKEAESIITPEGELTHESFADFCQHVAEDLSHDSLYEGEESPEQTLSILMALRNQWHKATQGAVNADNRDYDPKSLRQLVENEKPKQASVGARRNLHDMAVEEANINYDDAKAKYMAVNPDKPERAAEFDEQIKQKAERLYQDYLAASFIASTNRVESNKKLVEITLEVLRTVNRYAPADARFDELPMKMQQRLTQFALGAIDRVKVDLADRLASKPIEFGRVREAARAAIEALTKIVQSKYDDVGELEYAGMPQGVTDHNRAQKAAAIARID